jgi:opacity protein-like surface antigen
MKKKLLYSSALALLFGASSALAGGPEILPLEDYFSGFYIGGTVSLHHSDFESSTSIDLTNPVPPPPIQPILIPGNLLTIDADGESVDAFGGIQGGYGWTFLHRWYLGIQGFADFGTSRSEQQSFSTPVNFNIANIVTDRLDVENTTQIRLGCDYGVAGKLGILLTPMTLVYGKVGASWANLKVTNTTTANNQFNINFPGTSTCAECVNTVAPASSSENSTKIGLLLGIGAEQFIYQDIVSINVEYTYVSYGSVYNAPEPVNLVASTTGTGVRNFGPTEPVTLPVTTFTKVSQARVDSFLAGLNFYFGRYWF